MEAREDVARQQIFALTHRRIGFCQWPSKHEKPLLLLFFLNLLAMPTKKVLTRKQLALVVPLMTSGSDSTVKQRIFCSLVKLSQFWTARRIMKKVDGNDEGDETPKSDGRDDTNSRSNSSNNGTQETNTENRYPEMPPVFQLAKKKSPFRTKTFNICSCKIYKRMSCRPCIHIPSQQHFLILATTTTMPISISVTAGVFPFPFLSFESFFLGFVFKRLLLSTVCVSLNQLIFTT